jgi:DinB superfamily
MLFMRLAAVHLLGPTAVRDYNPVGHLATMGAGESIHKEKVEMKRCLIMTSLALASLTASPLYAQQGASGTPSTADAIRQAYNNIKNNLTKTADKMSEADYDFKPTPAQTSFGGWVAHVAGAQTAICSRINGAAQAPGPAKTSKADLQAALADSFKTCDAAYAALTDANANDSVQSFRGNTTRLAALAGNTAHDNECYGSMAVYLRLKGIVPPSTEAMAGRGR